MNRRAYQNTQRQNSQQLQELRNLRQQVKDSRTATDALNERYLNMVDAYRNLEAAIMKGTKKHAVEVAKDQKARLFKRFEE